MASEVHELLKNIVGMDIEPPVYTVTLRAGDHFDSFEAYCSFRNGMYDINPVSEVMCKDSSPEAALRNLKSILHDKFGYCPYCKRKGPKDD